MDTIPVSDLKQWKKLAKKKNMVQLDCTYCGRECYYHKNNIGVTDFICTNCVEEHARNIEEIL